MIKENHNRGITRSGITGTIFLLAVTAILLLTFCNRKSGEPGTKSTGDSATVTPTKTLWTAPDSTSMPAGQEGELIRYGRELIAHTSAYLGPNGKVMAMSNGMNCQNCHLDAGTRPWGNNYSAVYATYPKFRARSGSDESMVKRVNDCFERSLNGKALDSTGKEMRAIQAYMKWLGSGVNKGTTPEGAGLTKLAYLERAADPEKALPCT
jgi:thiosulfate dehydrogenase